MKIKVAVFLSVLLGFVLSLTTASPTGLPQAACPTLVPQHNGTAPSNQTSPYVFEVPSSPIIPGGRSWLITIKGISPSTTLAGFAIQARNATNPSFYQTYGFFELFGPDNSVQVVPCQRTNDTATHTNRNPKSQVQIKWNAPAGQTGSIRFFGTVVESFQVFYSNITSTVLSF